MHHNLKVTIEWQNLSSKKLATNYKNGIENFVNKKRSKVGKGGLKAHFMSYFHLSAIAKVGCSLHVLKTYLKEKWTCLFNSVKIDV